MKPISIIFASANAGKSRAEYLGDEIEQQSELVLSLFRKIDETFNPEQKELVQQLLIETNVLSAIYSHYEMKSTFG